MKLMLLAATLLVVVSPLAAAAQEQPRPKPAFAPSISIAFEHEQQVWNALKANDLVAFNRLVDPPFTYIDQTGMSAWNPEDTAKRWKDCKIASFTTEEAQTQHPEEGLVILSYKANLDQTCGGVKAPSPINVLSVWQRHGTTWRLIAHSETPLAAK